MVSGARHAYHPDADGAAETEASMAPRPRENGVRPIQQIQPRRARLGPRKTSSEVTSELDVARSTVVRTAHRNAQQGLAGPYDKRRDNGNPKVDNVFRQRVVGLLRRTPEDFG